MSAQDFQVPSYLDIGVLTSTGDKVGAVTTGVTGAVTTGVAAATTGATTVGVAAGVVGAASAAAVELVVGGVTGVVTEAVGVADDGVDAAAGAGRALTTTVGVAWASTKAVGAGSPPPPPQPARWVARVAANTKNLNFIDPLPKKVCIVSEARVNQSVLFARTPVSI